MNLGTEGKQEIKFLKSKFIDTLMSKLSLKPKEELEPCIDYQHVDLLQSIKDAKVEWLSANMNFEYATEQDMIDYYTYRIKACEVRYQCLLREAKEKGIKV